MDLISLKNIKIEECPEIDFKTKYCRLKEEYEKLKQQLKQQSNQNGEEFNTVKHSYFIISSLHKHPIEVLRRFINTWFCDVCKKSFRVDVPSYHCTLCDFDVCYNCVKNKVVKGSIKEDIKKFY